MENEEQDIIRMLSDKLRESEQPYKEGAWERFVAKQQMVADAQRAADKPATPIARTPVRSLIRPWMGVAAAILISIGAGWFYYTGQNTPLSNQKDKAQTAQNSLPITGNTVPAAAGNKSTTTNAQATAKHTGAANTGSGSIADGVLNRQGSLATINNINQSINQSLNQPTRNYNNSIIALTPVDIAGVGTAAQQTPSIPQSLVHGGSGGQLKITPAPLPSYMDLANENTPGQERPTASSALAATQPQKPTKGVDHQALQQPNQHFDDQGYYALNEEHQGKWDMGVMFVPGLSNDAKLNMGYGVSVGYQVNNRISLNSGVAYTALNGSKVVDPGSTLVSGGRALSSIDARVTGLNVPLEIRYHLNDKIYFGTGVSALAVLDDKVESKYALAEVQSSAFEARNGHPLKPNALQSLAANIPTKEAIPEKQVGAKDFAGYINFTFGLKQPLNKTKSLSIEPFVSVPMSNHLFNQNIKMTDGGIRIKLGL